MKKHSKKRKFNAMNQISGIQINYRDINPLEEGEDQSNITGLPYSHKNIALIPVAAQIFKNNRDFIFNNELNWMITVTPISLTGGNMREPMQHISTCVVDQLTNSVLDYIESTMNEIDMEFYSHWLFCCEVRK